MIRTRSQINPFFPKFLIMVFIAATEIRFLGDAMDQKCQHTWLNGLIKKQLLRAAAIGAATLFVLMRLNQWNNEFF